MLHYFCLECDVNESPVIANGLNLCGGNME